MPSTTVVRDRLTTEIAGGHANLDWIALALVAAEESETDGLATRTEKSSGETIALGWLVVPDKLMTAE